MINFGVGLCALSTVGVIKDVLIYYETTERNSHRGGVEPGGMALQLPEIECREYYNPVSLSVLIGEL